MAADVLMSVGVFSEDAELLCSAVEKDTRWQRDAPTIRPRVRILPGRDGLRRRGACVRPGGQPKGHRSLCLVVAERRERQAAVLRGTAYLGD